MCTVCRYTDKQHLPIRDDYFTLAGLVNKIDTGQPLGQVDHALVGAAAHAAIVIAGMLIRAFDQYVDLGQ